MSECGSVEYQWLYSVDGLGVSCGFECCSNPQWLLLVVGCANLCCLFGGGVQFESTQPYATVACLSFIQFRSNYCQRIKHALRR